MARRDFIPAARFRALTPVYDLLCRVIGLGAPLRRFEMGILDQFTPASILEVGCGTAELLRNVAQRFPAASVTGLDPDPDALFRARRKLAAAGVAVELAPGRAEALPFPDATFDLVVSSLMLHHLDTETKRRALLEWRRVLAPDGALVLVDFGAPRSLVARVLLWPFRFPILEEQADNFRGRIPGMLSDAGFTFEEAGVYGSVIVAYVGRPARSHSASDHKA